MTTSIWCYLWDLVDEGVDRVLDELQGAGLDGISVATAYHSVEHWRIHNVRPFVFRERNASLYFQPDRKLFAKTKLRPKVSPVVMKGNPLRAIGEKCRRRGLALNSWTVGTHNSYLCGQHPECAGRNAFGDLNATHLCPAHPEVRAYLRALVSDLSTHYPIRAVELESFLFDSHPHFHTHEKVGIQFGETDRFLLGLCFCQSCQAMGRKHGASPAAVQRLVVQTLGRSFKSGLTTRTSLTEFVSRHSVLRPYLAAREQTAQSLLAELRAACRARLVFMHFANRWAGGYYLPELVTSLDGVMLLCYSTPVATEKSIDTCRALAGGNMNIVAGFHAYPPATPDAEHLAAQVRAARRRGVRDLNFYNYGIMPRRNLAWIKRAARG